ncbi:putative purine permease [Gracilariopsis chorda]|uniref:Putative purine permease n=1 Tax=Gracilariopsis chorda TaxID=448386 RepID=A0A2V3IRK3_9FLOR|nr:putative purine permease [Gracilariopsis chorda]|eukprot:PXF44752.1 putative purine permease [Gracilariopsis chorda]
MSAPSQPHAPTPPPPSPPAPLPQSPPAPQSRNLVDVVFGDYDYTALCMPRIPCTPSWRTATPSIFFSVNERLPIVVGLLMGFQHALAMVAGIITVPRLLAIDLSLEASDRAYLTSSALTISGLMTLIQIMRFRLFKGYWIGTGLLSMSGVSFTFLPIAQAMFATLRDSDFCQDGVPCPDAYGRWLGTVMVGSLVEIALSFIPHHTLRKAFPPVVTGTTVLIIGTSLIKVGLFNWRGGQAPQQFPAGHARWIGLGFFVFSIIILTELFGSPFMRNTQVMIGLIAGIVLSAALGYLNTQSIADAPLFTFPLVRRFKLGFYGPALIPVMIAFAISAVEAIGDVTASCEVSRVETEGEQFESRIQGGLLADGLNSLLAALLTSSPTITFSQNNGVISMTRTASRLAGVWGAMWLIVMGVIGKLGGVFVALPEAVLGGMTTFLFASVAVSGLRILSGVQWDRRMRFILTASLGLGLGVEMVDDVFTEFIPPAKNEVVEYLRQGVVMIVDTGYSIGTITAVVLNLILPEEGADVSSSDFKKMKLMRRDLDMDTMESGEQSD